MGTLTTLERVEGARGSRAVVDFQAEGARVIRIRRGAKSVACRLGCWLHATPPYQKEAAASKQQQTILPTVGPLRCAFVCVCVCLCVYSRVGASCVGRPICVCAVLAPLRRVNKN